jgi:hypothetical protein
MQKLFKGGNYSRAETICGNMVYNEKVCNKPSNFLLQFSTEKAMVLNGLIYIFVHPNEDSIIAMRVEEHEMKKQLYKSQLLSNVTSLKTVIPFYS